MKGLTVTWGTERVNSFRPLQEWLGERGGDTASDHEGGLTARGGGTNKGWELRG